MLLYLRSHPHVRMCTGTRVMLNTWTCTLKPTPIPAIHSPPPPLPLNTLNVQMCKCCQAIGPNVVHTVIVNMGSFGIPGTRYCGTTPNEHSVTGIAQFPVSIAKAAMVILVLCRVGVLSRVVEVSVSLGPYIKFDCNPFVPSTGSCRHWSNRWDDHWECKYIRFSWRMLVKQ